MNEVLLEESAASHWQPESVSWIVSQALKRHSLHAPVFGRLEALLQIIDRCVAAEVEWTESGGSAALTANVALAIQVRRNSRLHAADFLLFLIAGYQAASLYLLNNKSIDGGKALQLTMKLHHLAGVARLSSSVSFRLFCCAVFPSFSPSLLRAAHLLYQISWPSCSSVCSFAAMGLMKEVLQ